MNSRERFLTALNGGVPDRVPVFDWIDAVFALYPILEFDFDTFEYPSSTAIHGHYRAVTRCGERHSWVALVDKKGLTQADPITGFDQQSWFQSRVVTSIQGHP